MSNSVVATVLEIEREAEGMLKKAGEDIEKLLADAKSRREAATKESEENTRKAVAALESEAAAVREKKVRELTAAGAAALATVRNVSDAAFDQGVGHILNALAK